MLEKDIYRFQTMRMFELNKNYIEACSHGNMEKVKFLLHSPDLNKNVNPTVNTNKGILSALTFQRYEVVNYLLFSKELNGAFKLDDTMLTLLAYNISLQSNSSFLNVTAPSIQFFNEIITNNELMENLTLSKQFLISLNLCKSKHVIETFLCHFSNKVSKDHVKEYLEENIHSTTNTVYNWLMKLENHKELMSIIIDNKGFSKKIKL